MMIKAVAFDLDGTLTRPFLNFKEIRLEIGVPVGRESLLDQIESMPKAERERALEILVRHEEAAADNAELNRGVRELLDYISGRGLFSAVVTRNSEKSTRQVLEKLGIRVGKVITRDSGVPVKPDPATLLSLAEEWRIKPGRIMMVGDHAYDVQCGKAAGSVTCLVTNGQEVTLTGEPDYAVAFPGEVILILESLLKDRG